MIIFFHLLKEKEEKKWRRKCGDWEAHVLPLNGRAIHRSRGFHFAWFVCIEHIQNCHKITINFSTNHTTDWQIRACIVRIHWSLASACRILVLKSIIICFLICFLRLKRTNKKKINNIIGTKQIGYQYVSNKVTKRKPRLLRMKNEM